MTVTAITTGGTPEPEPEPERLWVHEGRRASASPAAARLIGELVRAERKRQGYLSKELSAMIGASETRIADIEGARAGTAPSLGTLFQIAEALNVPVAALLPGDNEKVRRPAVTVASGDASYELGRRHGYLEAITRLQDAVPDPPRKRTNA